MNKLRKPKPLATTSSPSSSTKTAGCNTVVSVQRQHPVSRTMQIASASLAVETTPHDFNTPAYYPKSWFSAPVAVKPRTIAEQYWAARALVSETVLSTRVQHQKEVAEMRLGEEEKRTASAYSS
jgi:hypothetical protein